jgi:pimeloyl-ACP methyl ester carboxylesterase
MLSVLSVITAGFFASALSVTSAQAPKPSPPAPGLERFVVTSDGHPMVVWARKPATPRGTILLVHGRTWSARPDFDLQVAGLRRSVMQSFVAAGFAAYAVDLRGYGETARDATGWLTPRRAAADIANVLEWIAGQHKGLPKPTLVGWSRGAAMAGMVGIANPGLVSNVVMFGFAVDPDLQFANIESPSKPVMAKNTAAAATSDFVSPKITPKEVITAFVEQALKADPILADLRNDAEFNAFKPESLNVPTLVLYGSDDPGVSDEDAGKMFGKIAARDKQMIVLPGSDHAAHIEDTHDAWIAAILNFINRPPARR